MADCLITRQNTAEGHISHAYASSVPENHSENKIEPRKRFKWSGKTKGYLQFGGEALGLNGVYG